MKKSFKTILCLFSLTYCDLAKKAVATIPEKALWKVEEFSSPPEEVGKGWKRFWQIDSDDYEQSLENHKVYIQYAGKDFVPAGWTDSKGIFVDPNPEIGTKKIRIALDTEESWDSAELPALVDEIQDQDLYIMEDFKIQTWRWILSADAKVYLGNHSLEIRAHEVKIEGEIFGPQNPGWLKIVTDLLSGAGRILFEKNLEDPGSVQIFAKELEFMNFYNNADFLK